MSDKKAKDQPSKALYVLGIVFAWISLPIIGILLLVITSQAATLPNTVASTDGSGVSVLTLNALLGIILILVILLFTTNVRRLSYFFHLRIGMFIGLGIYTILFITGIVMNVLPTIAPNNQVACTSAVQQFNNAASAVVPIITDSGMGTGFAVNDSTTILTAFHVVDGATTIHANYSSGKVAMQVIDTAPQYDLALLKIDEPVSSFFTLSETYSVADQVYAYGYPSNSLTAGPPSLSTGIISRVVDLASLRMTSQTAAEGLEIIQTDAAINPGNSGGPLIGKCGVVGVVSFISDVSELHQYLGSVSEQNIGFAISAKTAKQAFPEHLSR